MKRIVIFLVLSLFFVQRTSAQFSDELYNQIDQCVNEYFEDRKFNGSVLVAKKGEILYKNGFGYASLEKKTKNNESTGFLIGSATKSFTAIAVMQCVEQGVLNLHTHVRNYIPELTGEVGELTLHYLMMYIPEALTP